MTKRAALYLHVSTGGQSTDNQPELKQLACMRGVRIVAVNEEHASAAKTRARFDALASPPPCPSCKTGSCCCEIAFVWWSAW